MTSERAHWNSKPRLLSRRTCTFPCFETVEVARSAAETSGSTGNFSASALEYLSVTCRLQQSGAPSFAFVFVLREPGHSLVPDASPSPQTLISQGGRDHVMVCQTPPMPQSVHDVGDHSAFSVDACVCLLRERRISLLSPDAPTPRSHPPWRHARDANTPKCCDAHLTPPPQ